MLTYIPNRSDRAYAPPIRQADSHGFYPMVCAAIMVEAAERAELYSATVEHYTLLETLHPSNAAVLAPLGQTITDLGAAFGWSGDQHRQCLRVNAQLCSISVTVVCNAARVAWQLSREADAAAAVDAAARPSVKAKSRPVRSAQAVDRRPPADPAAVTRAAEAASPALAAKAEAEAVRSSAPPPPPPPPTLPRSQKRQRR